MQQKMTDVKTVEQPVEERKPWTSPRVEIFSVTGMTANGLLGMFDPLTAS
jgi:hypothetical protein